MDLASLGIKVTTDGVQKAGADLDKLAASGDKAAASTDKLARANSAASKYSSPKYREQAADLAKLVGEIDPTVAALGRLDQQQAKLAQFKSRGMLDPEDFKLYSSKIDASRTALGRFGETAGKAGLSTKQLAFSARGLPAQFTDIAVSLQAGQRPLNVLLQQGGQLKDMFGGIGPAVRAMGGYLLGLINPLTVGAAAAAALAIAWKQGSDESVAFNKALITTGNYAGTTSTKLAEMAGALDSVSGVTQHSAAEAIAAVVSSGKFAGDQIEQVAKAALQLQQTTGASIGDTVKQFAALGKDPVNAILALNDAQHFLLQSQYDQIKALQDQGREQEAFALAVKVATESVNGRTKSIGENLGILERTLGGVKNAWREFWDAALDVGRAETPALKIKQLQQDIKGALSGNGVYQGMSPEAVAGFVARTKQKIADEINKSTPIHWITGGDGVVDSDRMRAVDQFRKDGLQYATKQAKLENDIAAAKVAGLKAGASQVEIDKRIADIRASYADKEKTPRAGKAAKETRSFRVEDMRQLEAEIAAEGKLTDVRTRGEETVKAYRATLADMLQTRQATIDLQVDSIGMGQKEVQQKAALIAIDEDYNRKKAGLEKQQRDTGSEIQKGYYQQQLDDLAKYHDERVRIEVDGARRADAARASFGNGAAAALADFQDSAADVAGQSYRMFSNAFDGMADSITQFVTTGKGSFSDLAKSIIADLIKIQTRILLSQALSSMFGGMGTAAGYNSASPSQQVAYDVAHGSANGNVFSSASLSAYSNTIVDKPTYFARGGNVMGEAGPEAIMPLTRGPNGKLGVQSAGGGGMEVEINITNTGNDMQARQTGARSDGKKMMIDLILETVSSDMAGGGKTAKAAQQRFGLARRGVPVAG